MVMKDVSNLGSNLKSVALDSNNPNLSPTMSVGPQKKITSMVVVGTQDQKPVDSNNFHLQLQQIEQEKGETEEVLSSLRGKLEEYRRLSHLKRQRLNERRGSELLENLMKDLPGYRNGAHVDDDLLRELLEKESKELEEKILNLERQKSEMEQTILDLFNRYKGNNSVLQREKERLVDDKDSTYAEMKLLLIEQHEEAERLRVKVSRLERKRKRVALAVKTCVGMFSLVVVGVALWLNYYVDDVHSLFGGQNYLCAPAKPGTQITELSGAVSSPWWAPRYTKALFFPLACPERPRIRMEIKRGILSITHEPTGILIAKKMGSTAYIEAEKLHISDTGGGHKEMHAPWAVQEVRGRRQ